MVAVSSYAKLNRESGTHGACSCVCGNCTKVLIIAGKTELQALSTTQESLNIVDLVLTQKICVQAELDQLRADAESVHGVREEMTAKLRAAIKKGKAIEKEAALLRPLPEKVAELQGALEEALAAAAAAGAAARGAEERLGVASAELAAAETRAAEAEAAAGATATAAVASATAELQERLSAVEDSANGAAEAGRRMSGMEQSVYWC